MDSSDVFALQAYSDTDVATTAIETGEILGYVYFHANFTQEVISGSQPRFELLLDMSSQQVYLRHHYLSSSTSSKLV